MIYEQSLSFSVLYVLVALHHQRRRVVHFNVTTNPTSAWISQQLREAFPWDTAPKYLIRDNDGAYGSMVTHTINSLGIKDTPTAPRSPWQNPFMERMIGTIRRDCLDHVIVLNETHLKGVLQDYFDYYHNCRTHMALNRDSPKTRDVHPTECGNVITFPMVGGIHHRYERRKAA